MKKKNVKMCRSCARENRPGFVLSEDSRYRWTEKVAGGPVFYAGEEVCCICVNDGYLVSNIDGRVIES